jgi:predicted transcriptional regulator
MEREAAAAGTIPTRGRFRRTNGGRTPVNATLIYASICHMKRTTVFIPEALERELQLCARQEGRPTASLVREALAEYVARHRPTPDLPAFVAAFASGRTDTADRHEDLVFRTLTPHDGTGDLAPAARRPPRRRR